MSFFPVLIQAAPAVPPATLRGMAAIEAADGFTVAVLGMGVVFMALFLLFLIMLGLIRSLEPKPQAAPAPTPAAPAQPAPAGSEGVSPQVVAAIATAIRLEQQRVAAVPLAHQPGAVSGWVVSRSLQWAAHQRIFQRSRS